MDNGFQYIDAEKQNIIQTEVNDNITVNNTEETITNDISIPDWDLLPPFDEVERGEVE